MPPRRQDCNPDRQTLHEPIPSGTGLRQGQRVEAAAGETGIQPRPAWGDPHVAWSLRSESSLCLCPRCSQPSTASALLTKHADCPSKAAQRAAPPATHTRRCAPAQARGVLCKCTFFLPLSPQAPGGGGCCPPLCHFGSYKYVCIVCASLLLYITLTFFVFVPGVLRQLQKGQPREEGIHVCLLVSSPALGSGPAGGAGHWPWPRGWGGLLASSSTWLQSPNSTDWC